MATPDPGMTPIIHHSLASCIVLFNLYSYRPYVDNKSTIIRSVTSD